MIIKTMNFIEISEELKKEQQDYCEFASKYDKASNARRILIKMKQKRLAQPYYFPSKYYTTNRNNCIMVSGHSFGHKEYEKRGLTFNYTTVFRYSKDKLWAATIAYNPASGIKVPAFYTPHLFYRYNERFLKDTAYSAKSSMEKYFSRNGQNNIGKGLTEKYPNSVISVVRDGILLGITCGSYFLFKTFVSHDMLKGTQVDYVIPKIAEVTNTVDNQTPIHINDNGEFIMPTTHTHKTLVIDEKFYQEIYDSLNEDM